MVTIVAMMGTRLTATGKKLTLLMSIHRCSSGCQVESGYNCTGGSSTSKDICSDLCGDGVFITNARPSASYCDDGNTDSNDGCSPTC